MHHYSSHHLIHHVSHPSLRHHTLKILDPFYKCISSVCWRAEQRYVVASITMLGVAIQYMQRMCLSIMMTEMVSIAKTTEGNSTCPDPGGTTSTAKGTFDWSTKIQGEILAGFFYGYFVTHIPGGIISDVFGGKHIFGLAVLLTSICSILTPVMARLDPVALLVLRIAMGLAQGPLFPAVTTLVAHWAPPVERGYLNTLTNSGVPLGLVLGNLISGLLLASWPPWDNVFYLYGGVGIMWFVFWNLLVSPTPVNHPFMKEQERDYILDTIYNQSQEPSGKIPWWDILLDRYFWFILLANFGHEWGLFFIATELPIFLSRVERLQTDLNGIASAVPWMFMWVGTLAAGWLAKMLEERNVFSTGVLRRVFALTANVVPAIALTFILLIECDHWTVVTIISLSNFFVGGVFVSVRCSCLDITPNFAGIVMSLVSGTAGLAGFAIPVFVHSVFHQGTKVSDWNLPVYVTSGIMAVLSMPYIIGISTKVQPWNSGRQPKTTQEAV